MRLPKSIIREEDGPASRGEMLKAYKSFLKVAEAAVLFTHRSTTEGMKACQERTNMIDFIVKNVFKDLPKVMEVPVKKPLNLLIMATGGYARGVMNRHSDLDITYLMPPKCLVSGSNEVRFVNECNLFLDDLGFEVGYATDSVKGRLEFANNDNPTKTTLITTRYLAGSTEIYKEFQANFVKKCIAGKENDFILAQLEELAKRHKKFENTPFVQTPNVKEGCGGLRDYQNLIWVAFANLRITDLRELEKRDILDRRGWNELRRAYDFLLRVRNELHYHEGRDQDVLTLQLQGPIATKLGYKGKLMTERIEAFMHDYYVHVRNVLRQSSKVMDRFNIEVLEKGERETGSIATALLRTFTPRKKKSAQAKVEHFDGFYSKHGRIFVESPNWFKEDPTRMMRLFMHTQQRHLRLAPDVFDLVCNTSLVNAEFRYHKAPRETFEAILEHKGDVARVLRQMHRCDFLGKYLPEFGALTCRVQHEFFHSYAADEHTLRCIDYLDELAGEDQPGLEFYQRIFRELHDPAVLYLALIMHDTGRAANKATHADQSTMLADKVCRRLQIKGDRRARLLFLVDNHLQMFYTATKKDPDDPKVVAEFANIVRTRENLDALTVMTMADCKGVGASGWTSFKDMSIKNLYQNTVRYLHSPSDFMERATVPLDDLKKRVLGELDKSYAAEVDVHFETMPRAYFNFRKPSTIANHLRLFRKYREAARPEMPAFSWEDKPAEGCSKFVVAGKDRRLLLGRCAGALATENLSIISADFYKRTDGLVLDVFRVSTQNFAPVSQESSRKRVQTALEEALMTEDFHFTHKIKAIRQVQKTNAALATQIPQWVYLNNRISDDNTVVEIQAIDRIGLLYDVFRVIGALKLNVTHARISTERGVAIDAIYVQTMDRQKVTDTQVLKKLGSDLEISVIQR
ncbi:MAG: [protein-PII] uridylyltransferase [Verrucomicrobiaceae bacterium]|nr:[protein-PII] uridylyltransferase [Verrucomicrobiaceae bacterium]